jgi:hypothetical protein
MLRISVNRVRSTQPGPAPGARYVLAVADLTAMLEVLAGAVPAAIRKTAHSVDQVRVTARADIDDDFIRGAERYPVLRKNHRLVRAVFPDDLHASVATRKTGRPEMGTAG